VCPSAVEPLLDDLPGGAGVLDTSNVNPEWKGRIGALDDGQVEPVGCRAARPPGRQGVEHHHLGLVRRSRHTAGSPDRIAIPVAADADADRALGMSLVEDTGLDAVDAGTLAESWRQQPGTPCYVTDLTRQELPAALAAAQSPHAHPSDATWR
jgi:8-hydroxy-5-deazaflavin:NADPH oxidoreductase